MAEETTPATTDKKPNTTMGLLCYLGILVIVPLLAVKAEDRDEFLKSHLRQGIGLLAFYMIIGGLAQLIGGLIGSIFSILSLILFVLTIIGIVNAVGGKIAKLPLLGDVFDKIGGSFVK